MRYLVDYRTRPHQTAPGPKMAFTYRTRPWEASRRHIETLQGPQKALKGCSQPNKVWCGLVRYLLAYRTRPHQTAPGPKMAFTYRTRPWEASRRHIETLQGPQKALKGCSQPNKVWCGLVRYLLAYRTRPHQTAPGPKMAFTFHTRPWDASWKYIESLQGPQRALRGHSQPQKVWCGLVRYLLANRTRLNQALKWHLLNTPGTG